MSMSMTARRCARSAARQELGISSVRGGGIVGEHDVLFCGPEEVADPEPQCGQPRRVCRRRRAGGALSWQAEQPGYYTMTDLLRGKLPCV